MSGSPSADVVHATFTELFRALGFGEDDSPSSAVVDYAYSYLSNDADVYVLGWSESGGEGAYMDLGSAGVTMHSLLAPLTLTEFHEHLDELDRRIGRYLAIDSIPAPDDEVEDAPEAIVAALAELFAVEPRDIETQLGRNWTVVANEPAVSFVRPERFVRWENRVTVGLGPEQLTFAPARDTRNGDRQQGEPTTLDWPETPEPLNLMTFAAELRRAADSS